MLRRENNASSVNSASNHRRWSHLILNQNSLFQYRYCSADLNCCRVMIVLELLNLWEKIKMPKFWTHLIPSYFFSLLSQLILNSKSRFRENNFKEARTKFTCQCEQWWNHCLLYTSLKWKETNSKYGILIWASKLRQSHKRSDSICWMFTYNFFVSRQTLQTGLF